MAAFYIVYIDKLSSVLQSDIKRKMDLSKDWYKINDKLWVLYTTSDANKLYGRLEEFVKDDGNLFISRLDVSDRQGWMSNEFWEWMSNLDKEQKKTS